MSRLFGEYVRERQYWQRFHHERPLIKKSAGKKMSVFLPKLNNLWRSFQSQSAKEKDSFDSDTNEVGSENSDSEPNEKQQPVLKSETAQVEGHVQGDHDLEVKDGGPKVKMHPASVPARFIGKRS